MQPSTSPPNGQWKTRASSLAGEGKTPMFVAVDGDLAGVVAVADRVKPESREAVAAMRALGLEVVMMTGDNRRTAEAVAREVEIERVLAEVLPEGKAREVRRLQQKRRRVGMVGMGSTMPPRWHRRTWASRSGPGRTWRWRHPT